MSFLPIPIPEIREWARTKGMANGEREMHRAYDNVRHEAKPSPTIRNAQSLRDKVFDPIKFIVKGYVVEGATILAGRPKIGKSWLVLDWALATARGGICFADVRCKEGAVLFIALEDNERRLKVRIKKILGEHGTWPEKFEYATEWPRANEGGLEEIRKWINAHEDARLVVVDVLQAFRTVAGGRDNLYASDYDAIKNLQAIASELHVAIIIVHHLRKGAADIDPQFWQSWPYRRRRYLSYLGRNCCWYDALWPRARYCGVREKCCFQPR